MNTAADNRVDPGLVAGNRKTLAGYRATHFQWHVQGGVGRITLNRPERKNPLTFESYAELRDLFRQLRYATDVHAIVAMASDLRVGTARAKVAFLFNRVGLAGCDMGACAMLPRIVGQGRASELLYTGRALPGEEAYQWGFFNRLVAPEAVLAEAERWATELTQGPTFANGITKTMLHQEWDMGIDQAIESEAQAQAICMLTEDFNRAYQAFVAKGKPKFEGN
jgi:enoyl-CoA hydratase/carnithine racemase